jgi:isopenicillin-N epimerase
VSPFRHHWLLEEDLVFLNHGSFGACPRGVRAEQSRLREEM